MFKRTGTHEEGGSGPAALRYAFTLLDRIEGKKDALAEIELPVDIDLQLARLLVRVLERQRGGSHG